MWIWQWRLSSIAQQLQLDLRLPDSVVLKSRLDVVVAILAVATEGEEVEEDDEAHAAREEADAQHAAGGDVARPRVALREPERDQEVAEKGFAFWGYQLPGVLCVVKKIMPN